MGANIGSYTHHLLVRGKPNICRFMVRTKVKNKGSKTTTSKPHSLSRSTYIASRRASTVDDRSSMLSSQQRSKIIRSISCPGANASTNNKHSRGLSNRTTDDILSNPSITGLKNDIFRSDHNRIQSLRIHNKAHVMGENPFPTIRTMPSTIEDDFSDEIFSTDTFDIDFQPNCEDNHQNDTTVLGTSIRSSSTQASDTVFQHTPLDPFHPQPIPEQHLFIQQQMKTTQQRMMQQQQQQQSQQQECHMLELQIQQLQNQIVRFNQHPQQQTGPNSSNYLCNGVAAIESSDRGVVTPSLSPREMGVRNNINHPIHQLEKYPIELMLNPTPIFSPIAHIETSMNNSMDCATMFSGSDTDMNMRRSISFCSFPHMCVP